MFRFTQHVAECSECASAVFADEAARLCWVGFSFAHYLMRQGWPWASLAAAARIRVEAA